MKARKTLMSLAAILTILFCAVLPVAAEGGTNYILETDGSGHQPTPLTYRIAGFEQDFGVKGGVLRDPSDLFTDHNGNVYIADTGNNRVVKLDADLHFLQSFTCGGSLNEPKGIYVDDDGDLYISDTMNERIVHLDGKGNLIEEFSKPESQMLDPDMDFQIGRIAISREGYLYTIRGQYFMEIDAQNEFKGFVGTNKVGFSLKDLFIRMFASKEQKDKLLSEDPASYHSFDMGDDGLIYATLGGDVKTGQIQVINMVEKNIYPVSTYGEAIYNEHTKAMNHPQFIDIAANDGTLIYVLEQYSKSVYVYDANGQLITVFGGEGTVKGRFSNPVALDLNNDGSVYVLDKETGAVHRFSPTSFMKNVTSALRKYDNGDYEQSMALWETVLDTDANYTVANRSLGDCYYKFEDYQKAMEQYQRAKDAGGYGKAFSEYRHAIFRRHFFLIVLITVAIAAVVIVIYTVLKRRSDKILTHYFETNGILQRRPLSLLQQALLILFHPLDDMDILKIQQKRKRTYLAVPLFLLLTILINYTSIFYEHYSLSSKLPKDANILLEAALVLVPFFSFAIGSYFMSAIMNGESKFSQQVLVYAYALVPYILLKPLVTLLSSILSYNEIGFYRLLQTVAIGWTLLLIFAALKRLNDYTFPRAIAVSLLALCMVVIMWAVVLLIASLSVQTGSFFSGLYEEFLMKYWS